MVDVFIVVGVMEGFHRRQARAAASFFHFLNEAVIHPQLIRRLAPSIQPQLIRRLPKLYDCCAPTSESMNK